MQGVRHLKAPTHPAAMVVLRGLLPMRTRTQTLALILTRGVQTWRLPHPHHPLAPTPIPEAHCLSLPPPPMVRGHLEESYRSMGLLEGPVTLRLPHHLNRVVAHLGSSNSSRPGLLVRGGMMLALVVLLIQTSLTQTQKVILRTRQ